MCNFRLSPVLNLYEHHTKAAFVLKLMVGGGEHKVVLDESGFRAYCIDVDWGLNFLSVLWRMHNVILIPHSSGGTGSNRGQELSNVLEEM